MEPMFNLPSAVEPDPLLGAKPDRRRLWTEDKAKLIERYLYYFVLVTHHGNYIDGFAGPHDPEKPQSWASNLVLQTEPRWLRRFIFCDIDPGQVERLQRLRKRHPERDIRVLDGDFNELVDDILRPSVLRRTQAAFCLLDQRTFECRWDTVAKLAAYKAEGRKIELFYFFANFWLGRAFAGSREAGIERIRDWWGGDDWDGLRSLPGLERARLFASRLRKELDYWHAHPWAIYDRDHPHRVMYYMIHATDHPAAPLLMHRAYRKAGLKPKEPVQQLALELGLEPPEVPAP
jgi:three-Cys-motif partner protein